jgi:hypothetical protein
VFAGSALITLIVLIVFGLRPIDVRSFSLLVPNAEQVALVKPGVSVCQAPIPTPSAVQTVAVWGAPATGSPHLTVVVRQVGRRDATARGSFVPLTPLRARARFSSVTASQFEYHARLNRILPSGRSFQVCVRASGGSFSLQGYNPETGGVTMTGGEKGFQFSLVLLKPAGGTLLGSLPTAFARASLFKLSWLRPWVFWLLSALLLATIVFGSAAISAAVREDAAADSAQPPARDRL